MQEHFQARAKQLVAVAAGGPFNTSVFYRANLFPRMSRFCLLLLLLLVAARPACCQTIDTEATTAYWRLTDALRRDEPLTDQAWRDFLALPANKIYVPQVYDEDDLQRYRQALEITYRPRYDSLRRAQLKTGKWFYRLLNDYREKELQYRAFIAETVKNPAFLENMYTYAYAYLPARCRVRPAGLRLYYTAIGDDATSQEGTAIVFSVWDAYNYQQVRPGILEAHELHHALLGQGLTGTEKLVSPPQPGDEGLLWSLRTALIEGLADLTDKKVQLEQSADSVDIRARLLRPAPRVLQKIDSAVRVQAGGGPATPLRFYRQLSNGSNGHLPGFYMAYLIWRNGYGPALLAHADDPFAFALLYQQAASRDKDHWHAPIFSATTVRYLRQLSRKYDRPHSAAAIPAP